MKTYLPMFILSVSICYFQQIQSFEDDFIEQMHTIEKNIQESFNNFHNNFFNALNERSSQLMNQINQTNTSPQQSHTNFYQQSSSSLSFANQDKAIKITEQQNQDAKFYIIEITNKKSDPTESKLQNNIVEELENLTTYIKKSFKAHKAETILEACIKTITQPAKNQLINIETSCQQNFKKYTIEVKNKTNNLEEQNNTNNNTDSLTIQEKKSYHYQPKNKKQ